MDKKEILEAVKAMNVLEVKELVEMFEEEFGVSAAAVAVAAPGAAADAGDDKSEYDVVLAEVGGEKIKVIKAIREITGLMCRKQDCYTFFGKFSKNFIQTVSYFASKNILKLSIAEVLRYE